MSDYLHAKTENVQKLLDNCLKKQKQELISEFLKEELVQDRLADAIAYSWKKCAEKAFENMGGLEGVQKVCKQLEEHGLTPERAEQMSTEEFVEFLEEHDIKVK